MKNKFCKDTMITVTGAKDILLFYSFMKEAKLTIKPNGRSQNCFAKKDMDETTIHSALKIITDKTKEDKIETIEAEIGALKELLRSMNEKLDKLT